MFETWTTLEKVLGGSLTMSVLAAGKWLWSGGRKYQRLISKLDDNHDLLVAYKKDQENFKEEVIDRFDKQEEQFNERFNAQAKFFNREFADLRLRNDQRRDEHNELKQKVAVIDALRRETG